MYQPSTTTQAAGGQTLDSTAVGPVVTVRGLRKLYGEFEALKGIDFELRAGEVFGLLGPNGAGKTTTVEILEGYRRRDGGEVEVLGADPAQAGGDWRERIGVVLQSSAMYETLTVAESLRLFAGYYSSPRPVDEVGPPPELIGAAPATEIRYRENGREVVLETDSPTRVLNELTAKALSENRELEGLVVRRPSLEEVYLTLTQEEAE